MRSIECLVVGGGPAGLAAARAAAAAGVRVLLADENLQPGGQYYRQPPPTFALRDGGRPEKEALEARALCDEVRRLGVEVRLDAVVWGIFAGRVVAVTAAGETERVRAETLILAPGAYDRPVPFPGWTLPGVVTAGGAQNLMKAYRVLPGRRVLVAGSGPLLLAVASLLLEGGARVEAVCEAASLRGRWRHGPRMLAHPDLLWQGYRYWRRIRRAGVPFLKGHVVRRALGDGEVSGAVVSRCDEACNPIPGTERSFEADALVVGYGFVPSVELGRLAGCEAGYDPERGYWTLTRTVEMETSVPGVFAAGDGVRVAGSAVALAEGHLAGLAAARRLGRLGGEAYRAQAAPVRRRLRHLAGFRAVMDALYPFGSGLYSLADERTVLCRCEEITVGQALAAVREGAIQPNEVKAWTRIGMGRCQGRQCGPALAQLIARETQRPPEEIAAFTPRPPLKPVPLGALLHEVGRPEGGAT